MKINAKQPSIKAYTLSHFKIGDVCMGVRDKHYYLVVKSEKEKKQIVDLTENEIIRDAGYMRFIPAIQNLISRMWGKRKMPVARCKYCNSLLFNEDVRREYIQINSDMKIQSKFICLKCEMELRKEDFFEPYRSMMK